MLDVTEHIYGDAEWGFRVPECDSENPLEGWGVVCPVQTHSVNVAIADGSRDLFPDTDALVTVKRGMRIGIRTADCVPIVVYAPDVEAVAAIHAGWKGTIGRIVENTVGVLRGLGACPSAMRVWFGPSVCPGCYEVDDALASRFIEAGFGDHVIRGGALVDGASARPHIDLQGCNVSQFIGCGVSEENIMKSDICTRHTLLERGDGVHVSLPSWRREKGTSLRMLTWIGLGCG